MMRVYEIVSIAMESCRTHRANFALATTGMIVGSASIVLVVTIGLTGKQFVSNAFQGIGANMIVAEYYGGAAGDTNSGQDYLTVADVAAVMEQVPDVVAGSPLLELHDSLSLGDGQAKQVLELGVSPDYRAVRNLQIVTGRFFDQDDSARHAKTAVVTVPLAQALFGGPDAALGRVLSIQGIPLTVIGTFRERVDTFGQSEIADQTVLLPYTVARRLTNSDAVQQLFFSCRYYEEIDNLSRKIAAVIQMRHRTDSKYVVSNLTSLVTVAGEISGGVIAVMLAVSIVTLIVGGVGVMNIMLATVRSRTYEIGIRKAVGATESHIYHQFLTEALIISVGGGVIGVVLTLLIAVVIRLLSGFWVLMSAWSILTALLACTAVGMIFGPLPARRAARLNPVDALKYE